MHFELNHYTKGKPAHIFFVTTLADGRFKYPVKEQCDPKTWKGGRTKDRGIDQAINKILDCAGETIKQHRREGQALTDPILRKILDIKLGREIKLTNFWDVINDVIANRECGNVLTKQGKKFSPYTIRNYRNSKNYLFEFNPSLNFDGVTLTMYDRLISFLNSKDHSLNTVGQTIKNLRVFMDQAKKDGYHKNLEYEDFVIPDEETFDVFLTEEEIDRIYKTKFSHPLNKLVQDWFVLDCYTGLRVSDIKVLGAEHLHDEFIRIYNEKTDTKVVVPLHRYVKEILKRHKGFPRKISDQKMNDCLKEIAEAAKINELVTYSITKGGVRQDHHLLKWQMVSNHTARRSFITNLLIQQVPDSDVMKLTGIKKHSTLMRYKKESEEEIARRMKGHKFFK